MYCALLTCRSIQRAVFKIMIAVFLSREFKHDETNRAWWTGRCEFPPPVPRAVLTPAGYGRGLGSSAFSQPAREFLVKIVEMSLFAADFLCGHFLLFFLTIPCLVPGIDILHSTMLCTSPRCGRTLLTSSSLAPPIEADSQPDLLVQAARAPSDHHLQVRTALRLCGRLLRRAHRAPGRVPQLVLTRKLRGV